MNIAFVSKNSKYFNENPKGNFKTFMFFSLALDWTTGLSTGMSIELSSDVHGCALVHFGRPVLQATER